MFLLKGLGEVRQENVMSIDAETREAVIEGCHGHSSDTLETWQW